MHWKFKPGVVVANTPRPPANLCNPSGIKISALIILQSPVCPDDGLGCYGMDLWPGFPPSRIDREEMKIGKSGKRPGSFPAFLPSLFKTPSSRVPCVHKTADPAWRNQRRPVIAATSGTACSGFFFGEHGDEFGGCRGVGAGFRFHDRHWRGRSGNPFLLFAGDHLLLILIDVPREADGDEEE